MNNLEIYNKLRVVPQEAKKPIGAGRLKGFTDINPMWRIKALTETFGPCGIGWWYRITDKHMEGEGKEVRAFVDIELYYRWGDQVSMPIPGTGGSSFLTEERNGAYTSDECYKMALTDAISVAAKALGLAADVYYDKDRDKYTTVEPEALKEQKPAPKPAEPVLSEDGYYHCVDCGEIISGKKLNSGTKSPKEVAIMGIENCGDQVCWSCGAARMRAKGWKQA